ncbi:class I SAM-dependent methyltransferase [Streptomyces beijiangensis]|uniref:Class I SAM-dependent methyltransferase n=1 Tax=Streptomyces beijiangensis TaxID=163361 RepID=A0A939F6Y8_9ACTN|nr:class I SAM-dependent methyltransferase [Streptomyces beijiangensis]MBO0513711.1 class I SAM-dependent methyltransferase [Streptomyces beijiangensis]
MHDPADEALSALTRPGMGTENAGPVLRALTRMARPRTVVEVGAGSSTLHLLLGLRDARAEAAADRRLFGGEVTNDERTSVLHPRSALDDYAPRLLVVDDISVAGTSAHQVSDAARALGLDDMLTFVERDFFGLTDQELDAWGPLDLVWLDAGTQADDAGFLTSLWPRVTPGGTVVLHEPYLATTAATPSGRVACRVVPTPLLQELRRQGAVSADGFDVLTLSEPHKHRQTGLLLLRKHAGWERDRGGPFAGELEALGETSAAEVPRLGPAPAPASGGAGEPGGRIVAALADGVRRTVYSAVVLRSDTTQGIAQRLGTPSGRCAQALTALEEAGLVTYDGDRWSAGDDVWRPAP